MKGGGGGWGEDSEDSGVTCLDDCDIVASEGPPSRRISIKQYWVIRQLFCFVNWTLEMDIPGIWQNFCSINCGWSDHSQIVLSKLHK